VAHLSAIDSIQPAIELTKQRLFRPMGIPLGIVAAIVYVIFKAQLVGAVGIAALVFLVAVFVVLIFTALGLLSAPLAVFYPAYSIYFFASRYEPLKNAMTPPPPPEPPLEPSPVV
jgi:hypothetical protein